VGVTLFYAVELLAMKHAAGRPVGALTEADRRMHRLSLASCAAIVVIFWSGEMEATWTNSLSWSVAAGAAIMAAGILLRGFAISQLGRQFISESSKAGQGELLQSGVYAWMRHPSETGLILIAAGVSLLMQSYSAALLGAGVLLPLIVTRIRLEERGLEIAFGVKFDRYRARVPALAPIPLRRLSSS
jgi:protein-S-isoprenylcysteine O-methyltransferase Ste14